MSATHDLKTAPEYFAHVWERTKTFEIRYDDRAYQPGDTVVLREYVRTAPCSCVRGHFDPTSCERYTGRWVQATIGYLTGQVPSHTNRRGFEGHGYVIFTLLDLEYSDELEPTAPKLDVAAVLDGHLADTDRVTRELRKIGDELEARAAGTRRDGRPDPRAVGAAVSRAATKARGPRAPRLAYSSTTPAGDA